MNQGLRSFAAPLPFGLIPEKRKVFISYHHKNDQWYYNTLSAAINSGYTAVQDNSLDRDIDSDDVDYVIQRIRDNYISGTSCTIVLCGAETGYRKYVDWEIKATLDKKHGLIGILLPTCAKGLNGTSLVPDRFHDNVVSGFALHTEWASLFPPKPQQFGLSRLPGSLVQPNVTTTLKPFIDAAVSKSTALISNIRDKMGRNGSPG
jgi:hypothetical protein